MPTNNSRSQENGNSVKVATPKQSNNQTISMRNNNQVDGKGTKLVNGFTSSFGKKNESDTEKIQQEGSNVGKLNGVKSSLEGSIEQKKPSTDRPPAPGPTGTDQGFPMRRNPLLVPAPSMGRNLVHLIHGEPSKTIQSHPDQSDQFQSCPNQKDQAKSSTNQSNSLFTPPKNQNGSPSPPQSSEKTKGFQVSKGEILKRGSTAHSEDQTSDYENLSKVRGNQRTESKGKKSSEPAFVVQVERESTHKVSLPQCNLSVYLSGLIFWICAFVYLSIYISV